MAAAAPSTCVGIRLLWPGQEGGSPRQAEAAASAEWWAGPRSGVRVDGRDVTQAVVEGPVREEAAVLGAAGHHVFRWLQWQRCGARGLGQGLIACGRAGEVRAGG